MKVHTGITPILELGVGWNPELDAIDNVFLIGTVMGLSLRDVEPSLDDILGFAEVERFARLKLKHYSSGMASRLAYAIAFHAVRDVLVLDEIFAVATQGSRQSAKRDTAVCARRGTPSACESRTAGDHDLLRPRDSHRSRPHPLRWEDGRHCGRLPAGRGRPGVTDATRC